MMDKSHKLASTSDSIPCGATFLFLRQILKFMQQFQPSFTLVALDAGGSFRKEIASDYKGNRRSMPLELHEQIPLSIAGLNALGLAYAGVQNFEADDIIATYAKEAVDRGHKVTIVSPDKDMMQL